MKNIDEHKLGDVLCGEKITNIFGLDKNWIVYEVKKNGKVAYYASDEFDALELLNPIRTLLIDIFGLIETKGLKKKFASRVASAYIACFNEHPETAKVILSKVLESVENYELMKSKLFYQLSCLAVVGINLLITYLLTYVYINKFPTSVVLVVTVVTFGSIGGFISVSLNINNLDLDIFGGTKTQLASGVIRIFIAMVSSLVIFVMIKSNLILGIVNTIDNPYVYYTLAVVSGFSLSFVPNIIKYIEKEKTPKK